MQEIPQGFKITDHLKTREVIEAMLKNNGGFCPCSNLTTEDFKCVCKKMREEGVCCCGYFVKL